MLEYVILRYGPACFPYLVGVHLVIEGKTGSYSSQYHCPGRQGSSCGGEGTIKECS